jgi:hypothetical protein
MLPPWHLWGNSMTILVPKSGVGSGVAESTQQLVRVSYARPESWQFLLEARLVGVPEPVTPAVITVVFDLVVGIGRSQTTLGTFGAFLFSFSGPSSPNGAHKYVTEVPSPLRNDLDATSTGITTSIVAQDIQLNARLAFIGGVPSPDAQVEVSAYFAPLSHVRPEWFNGQFRGEEDTGK